MSLKSKAFQKVILWNNKTKSYDNIIYIIIYLWFSDIIKMKKAGNYNFGKQHKSNKINYALLSSLFIW